MYPRALFRRFLAAPGRRAGAEAGGGAAQPFTAMHGAGLRPGVSPGWPRTRSRLLPGVRRWRPWPAEGGPAGGAVCSRDRCPRNVPRGGRRLDRHREDVAAWGDGLAGHVPASARLTRFAVGLPGADAGGLRPGCRSGNRGRSAKRADRSAGFANL